MRERYDPGVKTAMSRQTPSHPRAFSSFYSTFVMSYPDQADFKSASLCT
jgi:hypothetical protein